MRVVPLIACPTQSVLPRNDGAMKPPLFDGFNLTAYNAQRLIVLVMSISNQKVPSLFIRTAWYPQPGAPPRFSRELSSLYRSACRCSK